MRLPGVSVMQSADEYLQHAYSGASMRVSGQKWRDYELMQ